MKRCGRRWDRVKSEEEKDWARGLVSEGKRQEAKPAEARWRRATETEIWKLPPTGVKGIATSADPKGIT
jgi:hypothetical protein